MLVIFVIYFFQFYFNMIKKRSLSLVKKSSTAGDPTMFHCAQPSTPHHPLPMTSLPYLTSPPLPIVLLLKPEIANMLAKPDTLMENI